MNSQAEIRKAVTEQIIRTIEEGGLPPWRRCWSDDPNAPGLHTSLSTGLPYKGINQLILQVASMRFGYKSKWFGTFNQIRNQNASVRRGEKGHHVILWKPISRTRVNQHGDEVDDKFLIMREFVVFNAQQADGLPQFQVGFSQPRGSVSERYEAADRVIDATGARIEFGGNQACYRFHDDVIELPFRHQFESPESYYNSVFHELIHWTERQDRVGRSEGHKYAFGELVAEIGACLILNELHLPTANIANSASYLNGWLKGLANDSRYIFAASAQAGKAVDYILSFSRNTAETREPAIVI